MRFRLVPLLLAGILVFSQISFATPPSAALPLDSWVYSALDKLAGLGLVDSALQGTRPYTRLEAARQVREARSKAAGGRSPLVVYRLLRRLETELHEQVAELAGGPDSTTGSYLQPLRSLQLEYIYQDGRQSLFPGTDARQIALNYNNYGIEYSDHQNGQVSFESEARLSRFFLVNVRPLLEFQENDRDNVRFASRLLEGKAALGLGSFEFSAGRQSLWWGQGRHGSLVLTNNARPLDMLRVNNPHPLLLPWVFRHLGPFGFDLFLGRLDRDRIVPEPYFGGVRIAFKPRPWIELGACRTVIFGGEGRPHVGFSDFLTIIGGENLSGKEDTSNSVAAIDARIRLPFLWGTELYGEMGGEDESDLLGFIPFISNKAYLGGVYFPLLEPSGRLSLRIEYADLSHIDDNSFPWYRHGIYRSGYTYKGNIMGHHAGGSAKDIFSELKIFLPHDMNLAMNFDYEERGFDRPVREKHYQPGLAWEWQLLDYIAINARYAFDKVENLDFEQGNDRTFHLAEIEAGFLW